MVNFAKRDDGVVGSALAVALDVMKDLKWRMAIRISAFSMCMSNDFAFFTGGNVAGYSTSIRRRLRCASITGDTFAISDFLGHDRFTVPCDCDDTFW